MTFDTIRPAIDATRRRLLGAACLTALWPPAAMAKERLTFAVVPYLPARRLLELYAPLVEVFTTVLGRPVDFASAPGYPQHIERLRAGAYDIVADSLFIARIAQRELGHVPIARTAAQLEPLLVVRQDDPIQQMRALAGKRLAVTERSAALSVIGLRYLRDAGLIPDRDIEIVVTGTHANSLARLASGEVAAAIVSVTTLKQVPPDLAAKARVLVKLPSGLSAVIYHVAPRLAAEAPRLEQALIDFATSETGRSFLDKLGHKGLLPVTTAEMQALDPMIIEFYRQIGREGAR